MLAAVLDRITIQLYQASIARHSEAENFSWKLLSDSLLRILSPAREEEGNAADHVGDTQSQPATNRSGAKLPILGRSRGNRRRVRRRGGGVEGGQAGCGVVSLDCYNAQTVILGTLQQLPCCSAK